ncbi:MAG: hypothetical protein EBU29_07535 [Gammaproteobacteria bacterium]|nr:hypothetical protein [Gammaproteobacteria bacterium]
MVGVALPVSLLGTVIPLCLLPGHEVGTVGPTAYRNPDSVIANVAALGIEIALEGTVVLQKGQHLFLRRGGVQGQGEESQEAE